MKKIIISTLIAILVMSMFTIVNAASGSINLGSSAERVKPGETFVVTLIGTADNNITAMQANILYDSTKLAIESKKVADGFADFSGNNEIAIASTSSESLSKTTTLYTITFKALDNATVGEAKIDFTNISLATINESSEQEVVSIPNDSIEIDIYTQEEQPDNGNTQQPDNGNTQQPDNGNTQQPDNGNTQQPDNGNTQQPDNGNTQQPDNGNTQQPDNGNTQQPDNGNTQQPDNTNTQKDNTTAEKENNTITKLPQTGIEDMSIVAIIGLAVVSIVSYVSYRKYKNV